jgi:histidinol-phosphate/aromatic aminotransferase/cobyric acid decarboxylase-like protein
VVSVRAKFVFPTHPARGGAEFAAALREHAVLVRHFNKPRAAAYLRITIGTVDDTNRLRKNSAVVPGRPFGAGPGTYEHQRSL